MHKAMQHALQVANFALHKKVIGLAAQVVTLKAQVTTVTGGLGYDTHQRMAQMHEANMRNDLMNECPICFVQPCIRLAVCPSV